MTQLGDEPGGDERVPAQAEEVVAAQHGRGVEQRRPQVGDLGLDRSFAHMYHENFDEEAPSKKVISDVILKNGGIEWSGKTYLIAEEPKQAVRQLLEDSIKAGQRIFYYQELYEANPDYYSDMKVNSAEILEKIIRSTGIKLLYYIV